MRKTTATAASTIVFMLAAGCNDSTGPSGADPSNVAGNYVLVRADGKTLPA